VSDGRAWPDEPDADLVEAVAGLLDAAFEREGRPGVLPIVQAGDPVLRRVATPYTGQLGAQLPRLVEAMRRTMLDAPGVGLAAPQVGIPLAVAVCADPGVPGDAREREPLPFRVLVNPRYEPVRDGGTPERAAHYEGCLSVDGWQAVVARPRRVRLTGRDERGAAFDEVLHGWPARIVQHETDHLAGRLYLDRAEPRSLASHENLTRFGAPDAAAERAAVELGFPLPS